MFVIPSVILGFVLALYSLVSLNEVIFPKESDISSWPHAFAILQALAIGILIPFLSSIAPIQTAFSKNLNECLDIQRSKSKATMVQILDPKKTDMTSYLTFGFLSVLFGCTIYYFLPLAMLSFNISLVLKIFMFILIGMLCGLSLLAFNL